MKVIDLLNKIANGEEIPKYIKYRNWNNNSFDKMLVCKENIFYKLDQLEIYLNDEIEIIEEDKEIEEIKQMYEERDMYDFTFWESEFQTCTDLEKKIIDNISLLRKKQEELIKAVNELKNTKK